MYHIVGVLLLLIVLVNCYGMREEKIKKTAWVTSKSDIMRCAFRKHLAYHHINQPKYCVLFFLLSAILISNLLILRRLPLPNAVNNTPCYVEYNGVCLKTRHKGLASVRSRRWGTSKIYKIKYSHLFLRGPAFLFFNIKRENFAPLTV